MTNKYVKGKKYIYDEREPQRRNEGYVIGEGFDMKEQYKTTTKKYKYLNIERRQDSIGEKVGT